MCWACQISQLDVNLSSVMTEMIMWRKFSLAVTGNRMKGGNFYLWRRGKPIAFAWCERNGEQRLVPGEWENSSYLPQEWAWKRTRYGSRGGWEGNSAPLLEQDFTEMLHRTTFVVLLLLMWLGSWSLHALLSHVSLAAWEDNSCPSLTCLFWS